MEILKYFYSAVFYLRHQLSFENLSLLHSVFLFQGQIILISYTVVPLFDLPCTMSISVSFTFAFLVGAISLSPGTHCSNLTLA